MQAVTLLSLVTSWRSRFAIDFGSRITIPKRSPAELPWNHHFLLFFVVQVHFKFHLWDLLDFGGTFVAYIPLSCYPWRCQSFSGQIYMKRGKEFFGGYLLSHGSTCGSKSLMTVWVPRLVNTTFCRLVGLILNVESRFGWFFHGYMWSAPWRSFTIVILKQALLRVEMLFGCLSREPVFFCVT